jgi:hypothetical protein
MKYKRITFEEVRKVINNIIGYEPEYSYELTPNEIFCVIEETGIILESQQITGWTDFEYGKKNLSTIDLVAQTSIPWNSDGKTVIVTDECFKDQKAYIVRNCDLVDFADNVYPELHDIDFVQPFDLILINQNMKIISMIHHEGILMEYK